MKNNRIFENEPSVPMRPNAYATANRSGFFLQCQFDNILKISGSDELSGTKL